VTRRDSERVTDALPRPELPRSSLAANGWCLALVGASVLFLFAASLDVALWLRATNAELQLGMCRREIGCLQDPRICH
jgi:hypothetical protein